VTGDSPPTPSNEHVPDSSGHWCRWGSFDEIGRLLYHAKIRQVFVEADQWLDGSEHEAR